MEIKVCRIADPRATQLLGSTRPTSLCAGDGGFDVDNDIDLYVHFDHDFDLGVSKLHLNKLLSSS